MKRVAAWWLLAVGTALMACRPQQHEPAADRTAVRSGAPAATATAERRAESRAVSNVELPSIRGGGARAVRSGRGLVVSVERHATEAGVRILEAGGNAVDAAVATAYALAVTHPSAGNVGGGGFMLVRPKNGEATAIDFRERAPQSMTRAKFDAMIARKAVGPSACGVPGAVAGLELAHERFGKLPRADVIAPAIELATRGFALGARQALTIAWAWPHLKRDAAARALFGSGGKPKRAGTKLRRPLLAKTLERIAEHGRAGFYEGATAAAIVEAMMRGGHISAEDLSGYRAVIRKPLRTTYRGLDVIVAPPPSAGGVAVVRMLGMLEKHEAWKLERDGYESLHLFVEVARRAHATRRFDVVDPDSVAASAASSARTHWLDTRAASKEVPPIDPAKATPSSNIHPLYDAAMRELENTTHLSVVDADGMAVSLTTTLSAGFGARFVVPRTGIVMNNSLAAFGTVGADVVEAGRRMTSSMSPTLVVRDGATTAVLGTPGGDTIPNTVVQVLRNLVDYGMTIDEAVDAPRVHHGFVPDEIRYEGERPISQESIEALKKLGHSFSKKRIPIGDANDLVIADEMAWGYADPREGGHAAGPK